MFLQHRLAGFCPIVARSGANCLSTEGGLLQYMARQDQWDHTLQILS